MTRMLPRAQYREHIGRCPGRVCSLSLSRGFFCFRISWILEHIFVHDERCQCHSKIQSVSYMRVKITYGHIAHLCLSALNIPPPIRGSSILTLLPLPHLYSVHIAFTTLDGCDMLCRKARHTIQISSLISDWIQLDLIRKSSDDTKWSPWVHFGTMYLFLEAVRLIP